MYFFLFDVVVPPAVGSGETDGFAIIWVNSARYPDAERAALEFAGTQGLTVRTVQSAHKPSPEQLATMSLEELAARARGMQDGVWGYFVPRVQDETGTGPPLETRPLTRPPDKP